MKNSDIPSDNKMMRASRMGRLYRRLVKEGLYVVPIPDEKSGTILELVVAVDDAKEN